MHTQAPKLSKQDSADAVARRIAEAEAYFVDLDKRSPPLAKSEIVSLGWELIALTKLLAADIRELREQVSRGQVRGQQEVLEVDKNIQQEKIEIERRTKNHRDELYAKYLSGTASMSEMMELGIGRLPTSEDWTPEAMARFQMLVNQKSIYD